MLVHLHLCGGSGVRRWRRGSEEEVEAGVRGGGGGRGPRRRWRRGSEAEVKVEAEAEAEFDMRVRISCGVLVKVVQASGFARGVSIPVFVYQSISVYIFPVSE